jgi:hypothetical protein
MVGRFGGRDKGHGIPARARLAWDRREDAIDNRSGQGARIVQIICLVVAESALVPVAIAAMNQAAMNVA